MDISSCAATVKAGKPSNDYYIVIPNKHQTSSKVRVQKIFHMSFLLISRSGKEDFLMNLPLLPAHKTKIGTCPHGLPAGACPICSGMGGGGGPKKTDLKSNGEMSWDECFAIGQMLKAQRLAQQQKDVAMQGQLHTPLNAASKLENIAQKIAALAEKLTNFVQKSQTTSTVLSKTLAFAAKLAIPLLNVLKNIPILIQKAMNFVKEKLADITDKLNAVFGELKNATEKKISEKFKNFRKKFKSLFETFIEQDIETKKQQ